MVRGCVVELEKSEKETCITNDESCKTCFEGDGCNRQPNFSKCFVTDQPLTNALPPYVFDTKSSPKVCRKYNDTCFTQVIENDTVIRGCVDEYAAQNDLSSNFLSESGVSNRTYQVCSTPLCNDKKLTALFCLACNSTDDQKCVTEPGMFEMKCPLELNSSGCYHFDNRSYVERGCIVDLNEDQRANCESDSENCKQCTTDKCNNKIKFMACYWNNSTQTIDNLKMCKRYDDQCYIHAFKGAVRRGCLNDDPDPSVDILSDCKNEPEICELCSESYCNSRYLPEEYCYSCNSSVKSMNCKYSPTPDMNVKCSPRLKKYGCYHRYENKFGIGGTVSERGCVSDLEPNMRTICQTPSTNSSCKICEKDGCNNKLGFQMCAVCSSKTNKDCIDCWQNINGPRVKSTQCENYMDQCYTHVENEIVTRNCTDPLINTPEKCASDPEHCQLFAASLANGNGVERDNCVSCDSNENPKCRSAHEITDTLLEETLFKEYPLSIINKGCYHFVDEKSDRHIRGMILCFNFHEEMELLKKKNKFFRSRQSID